MQMLCYLMTFGCVKIHKKHLLSAQIVTEPHTFTLRSILEGADYLYCDKTGAVFGDAGKCLQDKCAAVVENGLLSTEKAGDYYVYAKVRNTLKRKLKQRRTKKYPNIGNLLNNNYEKSEHILC